MQISRAALKAAIDDGHRRGMKITGHLCSVTYGEAADLGIDNLEHGFFAATDFVADKQPDVCPGQARGQQTIAALDENGEPFKALVKKLVDKHVALTSTLTVFETFTPGRPLPQGLDVLAPQLKDAFQRAYDRAAQNQQSVYTTLFPKAMRLERAFAKAGGMLIAGTDPTGAGGVVPGYADQRQIELLVEAGFTPARGDLDRHAERRKISRPGRAHRIDCDRQTGGSGRRRGRPVDDDRGYPSGRHGVQGRRRLRSAEVDRLGARPGRDLVEEPCRSPSAPSATS